MGTGFVSHTLCTAAFVSGVDVDRAYQDAVRPVSVIHWLDPAIRYRVDPARREVRATLLGGFEQRAVLQEGGGCQSHPSPAGPAAAPPPIAPSPPEAAGAEPVDAADPELRQAVLRAFAPSPSGNGARTKAIVVVQDGRIVAERYGQGYGPATRLPGYSDTKSVVSALVGILVRMGRVDLAAPAPIAAWAGPGDPRHGITVDALLRMRSGLRWEESLGGGADDAARMWFLEPDMAAVPMGRPLREAPGTRWQYDSGNTMILSRIIRDAVGGTREAVLRFARDELFGPLGMESATLEFDATGTPAGASGMLATARDWARFGQLYLDDGMAGSRRILPEGWVEDSATPTPGAWVGYGAGFWTNRGDSVGAARRVAWGMPAGSFFASGFMGQVILVIPAERLVIARFGWSHGEYGGLDEISRAMGEIAAAARKAATAGAR
jgi:CubicO group peptidase (beta-lactamase class C family)